MHPIFHLSDLMTEARSNRDSVIAPYEETIHKEGVYEIYIDNESYRELVYWQIRYDTLLDAITERKPDLSKTRKIFGYVTATGFVRIKPESERNG